MRNLIYRNVFVAVPLLLSISACRPVITIGWQEITCVLVLLAFLLGPPIYRLFLRFAEFQSWRKSARKEKKD
jgi:hypothetical protein